MSDVIAWVVFALIVLFLLPADRSMRQGCGNGCSDPACYMTKDCGGFDQDGST